MIDVKTNQRIVVKTHSEYGPYIMVSSFQDAGAIEDEFDDNLFILYWTEQLPEFKDDSGRVFYFGSVADAVKLQEILDDLTFPWTPKQA